jgi:hypothetical protein
VKPGRIEVEIEELVLHGFPPTRVAVVRDAVQRELESLVRDAGGALSLSDGTEIGRVDGGQFTIVRGDTKALGAGVAACLGRGLIGKTDWVRGADGK